MNLMQRRRSLMAQTSPAVVHGTWEDLFRAINAGTYATEYEVGETLPLDLGTTSGFVNAKIIGFDTDTLADGSGTAAITFAAQYLILNSRRFNPARSGSSGDYTESTGTIGGWEKSELRSYIQTTVKSRFPENVLNRIVSVKKYSRSYDSAGTVTSNVLTNDDLWIPCCREAKGANSSFETTGVSQYSGFSSNAKRLRTKPGSSTGVTWWLRTAYSTSNLWTVSADGSSSSTQSANSSYGVLLCFCVN